MRKILPILLVLVIGFIFLQVDSVDAENKNICTFKGVGAKYRAKATPEELKEKPRIPVNPSEGIRFVVPQKIALEDVEIYMRVLEPGYDKKIIIMDGQKVLKSKKFKRVAPPEMIKIRLKKDEIEDAKEITVAVE